MQRVTKSEKEISTIYNRTSILEAIDQVKLGKFVVVMDNEDRENEGDLILPAELATEENLAFMIRYCSGVICVSATSTRLLNELNIPLMVQENTEIRKCKFTVSVDFKHGTSSGISAADRAATIRSIADINTNATDFNKPGHVFPLVAMDGGVISRAGHTEAAVDIAKLANCKAVGFLCELNDDNGKMLRRKDLELFAKTHQLPLITISDLIKYRFNTECLVERIHTQNNSTLKTPFAEFDKKMYRSLLSNDIYQVLLYNKVNNASNNSNNINISHSNDILVYIYNQNDYDKDIVEKMNCFLWAQKYVVNANRNCIFICRENNKNYNELENISGKSMAKETYFGMAMQIIKELKYTNISLLKVINTSNNKANNKISTFDYQGYGIQVNGYEIIRLDDSI